MQVVIDIPERMYTTICGREEYRCNPLELYIKNGTVLPKGHGDLIDRSKLKVHHVGTDIGTDCPVYLLPTVDTASAIIEADKEV